MMKGAQRQTGLAQQTCTHLAPIGGYPLSNGGRGQREFGCGTVVLEAGGRCLPHPSASFLGAGEGRRALGNISFI